MLMRMNVQFLNINYSYLKFNVLKQKNKEVINLGWRKRLYKIIIFKLRANKVKIIQIKKKSIN